MKPHKPVMVAIATLAPIFFISAQSKSSSRPTIEQLAWAQEFLHSLYPQLSNANHSMTAETSVPYDKVVGSFSWLTLYVGEGFRYSVLGMRGGCMGDIVPPSPPLPPELKTPDSDQSKPNPEQRLPPDECQPGPIYPRQFLTTRFDFDQGGHLVRFGASGIAIQNVKANRELKYTPQMSDAEIAVAIKKSGAKYGPDDKAKFTANLPLKNLERFLGKLDLISVSFHPLSEDRAELPNWPDWTVRAKAIRKDGSTAEYRENFDYVTGDLIGLCAEPHCSDLESLEWLRSNKK